MRNKLWKPILMTSLVLVLLSAGCASIPKNTESKETSNTISSQDTGNKDEKPAVAEDNHEIDICSETPMDEKYKDFEVIIKDTGNKDKNYLHTVDSYSRNKITGEETFIARIENFNGSHYHGSESVNGTLYMIRSVYDEKPDGGIRDELWKIRPDGKVYKMYENNGLDFRVSYDENLIAVLDTYVTNTALKFLDRKGTVLKEYTLNDLYLENKDPSDLLIEMYQWSKNSKTFFGNIFMPSGGPLSIYKVETNSWNVTKYDVLNLYINFDMALNTERELVAYSTYPVIVDADTKKEYDAEKREETLYVYNLKTGETKKIASAIANPFKPVWIDANTLEYNNPDATARLKKTMK